MPFNTISRQLRLHIGFQVHSSCRHLFEKWRVHFNAPRDIQTSFETIDFIMTAKANTMSCKAISRQWTECRVSSLLLQKLVGKMKGQLGYSLRHIPLNFQTIDLIKSAKYIVPEFSCGSESLYVDCSLCVYPLTHEVGGYVCATVLITCFTWSKYITQPSGLYHSHYGTTGRYSLANTK